MKTYINNSKISDEVHFLHAGIPFIAVEKKQKIRALTSPYCAEFEKENLLKKVHVEGRNFTIIIFGIGTGEFLEPLLNSIDETVRVIIVEPSYEIYREAMHNNKIDNEMLEIFIGKLDETALEQSVFENHRRLQLHVNGNYKNIFMEEYSQVVRVVAKAMNKSLVNDATLDVRGKIFNDNIVCNIFEFNKKSNIYSVNSLKGKFRNVPALIVSAGPSLDKQLSIIKEFKGIVIAGGRTLSSLLKNDRKPDLIVSVDPCIEAYKLIEDELSCDIPLVTCIEGSKDIIHSYRGPKYVMNSSFSPLSGFFDIEVDCLDTGFSVANASYSLTQYMGCSPIVFIGQDLALTNEKLHAKSAIKKIDNLIEETNVETLQISGYDGDKVLTTKSLYAFLKWFENKITYSKVDVINATEGGAKIKGTKQMSFKEVVEVFKCDVDFHELSINENISLNISELKLKELVDDIMYLEKKCTEARRNAESLVTAIKLNEKQSKINYYLRKSDELDEILFNHAKSPFLGYIISSANAKYKNSATTQVNYENKDDRIRIVKNNALLYNELYKMAKELNNQIIRISKELL